MALLPEVRRAPSALERWDPFRELDEVSERMRRLLDETFAGTLATPPLAGPGWAELVWTGLVAARRRRGDRRRVHRRGRSARREARRRRRRAGRQGADDQRRDQGARAQGRPAPAHEAERPLRLPGRAARPGRERPDRGHPRGWRPHRARAEDRTGAAAEDRGEGVNGPAGSGRPAPRSRTRAP